MRDDTLRAGLNAAERNTERLINDVQSHVEEPDPTTPPIPLNDKRPHYVVTLVRGSIEGSVRSIIRDHFIKLFNIFNLVPKDVAKAMDVTTDTLNSYLRENTNLSTKTALKAIEIINRHNADELGRFEIRGDTSAPKKPRRLKTPGLDQCVAVLQEAMSHDTSIVEIVVRPTPQKCVWRRKTIVIEEEEK